MSTLPYKPLDQLTLSELYAERTSWNRLIATIEGSGQAVAVAIEHRNACTAMIWSRLREIEGEANPHGEKLPDTNKIGEAA